MALTHVVLGVALLLYVQAGAGFTVSKLPAAPAARAVPLLQGVRCRRFTPPFYMVLSDSSKADSSPDGPVVETTNSRRMMERVCQKEAVSTREVCNSVRRLEAEASRRSAAQNERMFRRLDGRWTLVWTRDDKRPTMTDFFSGGKLLYFSPKSTIHLDLDKRSIVERLHVGPFAYEMSGPLEVLPLKRRIDFFFNILKLGPLRIPIDLDFSPVDSKSTFRFIDVTDTYALARGSFHDIGLWRRVPQ